MKQLFFIVCMFITGMVMAQSKYEAAMTKGLAQMKEARSAEDMASVSAFFERVGEAEKDKWLPYYYAAYTNYMTAWMDPKADKDKVSVRTKELIGKAEGLETNAELYCLRQMVAVQQLTVDGMTRFQTYGAEAKQALDNAKKIDPNNPRIYYLEGQFIKNVPEPFGGGKAPAKKLLEKSVELFKTFQPASPLHPNWGKADAEKLLAECQ